jgi:hypothetical protein
MSDEPKKTIRLEVDLDAPKPSIVSPLPRLVPTIYVPPLPGMIVERSVPAKATTASVRDVRLARALERLTKELKQDRVAEKLGYDVRTIRRWIRTAKFSKQARKDLLQLLSKPDKPDMSG